MMLSYRLGYLRKMSCAPCCRETKHTKKSRSGGDGQGQVEEKGGGQSCDERGEGQRKSLPGQVESGAENSSIGLKAGSLRTTPLALMPL